LSFRGLLVREESVFPAFPAALKSSTIHAWRLNMSLTAEQREQVATELKRFAGDLNLTNDQKEKLQAALAEARERVGEYLKDNPTATKADIIAKVKANRDEIRQRVVNFLTPDQLSKWDSEVSKAKEFLGHRFDG